MKNVSLEVLGANLSINVDAKDTREIRELDIEAFGEDNAKTFEEFLESLVEFLRQKSVFLIIARDTSNGVREKGKIIGMATLFVRMLVGGYKVGWLDDVTTRKEYRGKGVGELLEKEACKIAHRENCDRIDLSNDPEKGSSGFWSKRGYEERKTRMYRKLIP